MPFSAALQALARRPMLEGVSYTLTFACPSPRQATVRRVGGELHLAQADGAWVTLGRIYPARG